MIMKRINAFLAVFIMGMFCPFLSSAQIGYQVSLLNTATGEPRANVTVNAAITITNSEDGVIYTGNQTATSNDFGVIQLTVGNEDTFKNVDWSKLPLFIEVSIDGAMIAKSQILSVPVAEVAKQVVGDFTIKDIVGKWKETYDTYYVFNENYTFQYVIDGAYFCGGIYAFKPNGDLIVYRTGDDKPYDVLGLFIINDKSIIYSYDMGGYYKKE